jgi:hypothetical protein
MKNAERPGKATQSDIKATTKRVDRQPVATPMRPQSHPKAPTKLQQCYPKAISKRVAVLLPLSSGWDLANRAADPYSGVWVQSRVASWGIGH